MKWFRHMTNASNDEFIAALEDEFDDSGYAWWWRMLERIGDTMDKSNRSFAEYPVDRWMGFLRIKRRKKLEKFLEFCAKSEKISYNFSENILKIDCPKLLELRDEYSRKSGQSTSSSQDKVAPETDTETDTELLDNKLSNNTRGSKKGKYNEYTKSFEQFWGIYPRNGASKVAAFKSWGKFESGVGAETIIRGASDYAEYVQRTGTRVAHATTWLNQERWTVDYGAIPSTPERGHKGSAHDTFGKAWSDVAQGHS